MLPSRLAAREARVEWEPDPDRPGRRTYKITGPSKDAVQAAVSRRMAFAARRGGYARFFGPARVDGGFGALGETVVPA